MKKSTKLAVNTTSTASKTLHIFWQEVSAYPFKLTFSLTNPVITVLADAFAGPYIISVFLARIQSGSSLNLHNSLPLIGLYAASQLYGQVIGWRLTLYAAWSMEVSAERNLYSRIYKHLSHQSTGFHANRFGGSLVSQTNKLVGSMDRFWDSMIYQLIPSIVAVLGAVTILSFIFWQYALVLLILSILFTLIVVFGNKKVAKYNIEESKASNLLTGRLADGITNILAIKSHGEEDGELKSFGEYAERWFQKNMKSMHAFLKVSSVYSSIIVILNISALMAAVSASQHHIIALSAVYLCVTYTFTVARQLWEMNNITRNLNRVFGDAYEMTEILGIKPDIVDKPDATESNVVRGDIRFKNVTFGHDETDKQNPLFKDLNLHIKGGEKIGLIGHSGGGKTTLSKLIMRFMEIQDGQILVDNHDITDLKQGSLRQSIAYVPQEPILFHRTLAENIRYGRPEASDKELKIISKLAHADDFIQKLPKGYETLVGERGVKLSGGQRQRVVIARAMLKNAPILLLDEATSALDSESEELIQEALWKLMEGRTAIVIAHRLSTIQKMDRIIVLEKGSIVEEGSHKELIRLNGVYASLWNRQSGGFLKD
jgi:ATP-binding cassette subfamily B protein